jgi:hypothetical protein
MRHFCLIAAFVFLAVLATPGQILARPSTNCVLPDGLREEVAAKYSGTHVLTLADLSEYDKRLFRKDHGARCPGLVRVNFYGDGKPTWAFVLTVGEKSDRTVELIVARQLGGTWDIRSLAKTTGSGVVWRQAPGKYEGMYDGEKTIIATRPVIVLCGYGSWEVVYAWTGSSVEKVWLSD